MVYTAGAFDCCTLGIFNSQCGPCALGDMLVVGVSTDELIMEYKGHAPTVPYEQRRELVRGDRRRRRGDRRRPCRRVRGLVRLQFDRWVVGDDWFETEKYQEYRRQLEAVGVQCTFLPYTAGVSGTMQRRALGA